MKKTRRRLVTRWEQMDKSSTPLQTVIDHYLTTCRTEGKTPKTVKGYTEKLSRFGRWLNGSLGELTLEMVRTYIGSLQSADKWAGHPFTPTNGQRLSATSVADHVRVLKGFSTWLFEEGYKQTNELGRLALPKAPRKVIDILSEEEVARLLSSIDPNTPSGCRDLALIALLLDTGLRSGELISLKLLDVHFEEQWLKVMGKGQKERLVPVGARSSKLLTRYMTFFRAAVSHSPELFLTVDGDGMTENTVKMLFTRLRRKSGIGRLHPHLLRHTFATWYLIAGGDVFTLQHILGHTTLEMTRRYVTLANSHVNIQHARFSPMDRMSLPALRSNRRSVAPVKKSPRTAHVRALAL